MWFFVLAAAIGLGSGFAQAVWHAGGRQRLSFAAAHLHTTALAADLCSSRCFDDKMLQRFANMQLLQKQYRYHMWWFKQYRYYNYWLWWDKQYRYYKCGRFKQFAKNLILYRFFWIFMDFGACMLKT